MRVSCFLIFINFEFLKCPDCRFICKRVNVLETTRCGLHFCFLNLEIKDSIVTGHNRQMSLTSMFPIFDVFRFVIKPHHKFDMF